MATKEMKISVPIPDSSHYRFDQFLPPGTTFDSLVDETATMNQKIKELEAEIDVRRQLIQAAMTLAHAKTCVSQDYQVTLTEPSRRSKLDKNGLLNAGVSPQQIALATVFSVGQPYIKITRASLTPETQPDPED